MPERKPADIHIDYDLCKVCYLCIGVCPVKVYTQSDYVGDKGAAIPLITHPEKCIHCYLCELMCPDLAITVKDNSKAKSAIKGV
jgi:2-oxoglutarate ferredoxin oxidoreductase subunit delta